VSAAWIMATWASGFGVSDVRGDVSGAVAALRDRGDVILVVNEAGDLRRTPIGRAAMDLARAVMPTDEIEQSWSGLAKALGTDRGEAFDLLLGQRAALVFENRNGAVQWVVLSEVTLQVEKRLLAALEAAPRWIVAGHHAFDLEQGRYLVATCHQVDGSSPGRATIALAGKDSVALFKAAVAVLCSRADGQDEAVGSAELIASIDRMDLTALWRPGPRPDQGNADRDESTSGARVFRVGASPASATITLSASFTDDGASVHVRSAPGFIDPDAPDGAPMLDSWPVAAFGRATADAMVALMFRIGSAFRLEPIAGEMVGRLVDLAGLNQRVGPRLGVVIGHTTVPDARGRVPGPIWGGVLFESRLSPAAVAPLVDVLFGQRLSVALETYGSTDAVARSRPPEHLVGAPAEAVRVEHLEPAGDSLVGRLLGPDPVLAWKTVAGEADGEGPRSWTVVALGSDDGADEAGAGVAQRVQRLYRALSGAAGPPRPLVSFGSARPREVIRALTTLGGPIAGLLRPLERIESINWRTRADPDGSLDSTISIRVGADAPRRDPAGPR